ncbi:MAG: septum formation initiator family protein [Bacillus sp. (in: firmicutes)]
MDDLKERNVTKMKTTYVQQKEEMKLRQKKKRRGLVRRLTLFGAVACLFLGLILSTIFSQASAIEDKKQVKQETKEQLASLKKEQQELEEEILKLNDDEYIAKIARRDYYLSNEGEIIFNLPKNDEEKD